MQELTPEQVLQVSQLVAQYISNQRDRYAIRGVPLSAQQTELLGPFFSRQAIESVRLCVLVDERIDNPDFYPVLLGLGFENLPDQSTMAAVTFSDTIVSHGRITDGLLFHELVHVEQYRQLGIAEFSNLYVRGFLAGGGYDGIPLERNAYALGARFEAEPTNAFSVEAEVATCIVGGLF